MATNTDDNLDPEGQELLDQRKHHPVSRRSLAGIVSFIVILALGQFAVTMILLGQVKSNSDRIDRNERRDHTHSVQSDNGILYAIKLSRNADLRQCVRGVDDRVVINLLVKDLHDNRIRTMRLLNCTPNLVGQKPTQLLTPTQMAQRYKQARRGELP